MSAVVSGIIGGVLATLITSHMAKRARRGIGNGRLRHGVFMWILAVACLAFALFPIAITWLAGHDREFWAKLGLFLVFGIAAVYCFGEAAGVRGSFDDESITFTTPWTGRKHERWRDLVSIELSESCSWYVLTFRSGARIRLSTFLSGYAAAVDVAQASASTQTQGDP